MLLILQKLGFFPVTSIVQQNWSITPEYPTHPTVLGLGLGLGSQLRLGLGLGIRDRYVCRV